MTSRETTGLHLWLLLWKAFNSVRAYATGDIEKLGLGLSDFAILEVLLHKGPAPVNEIGKRVLLTSGSMTVAVDRLERKGLVERRSDETDRRTRVIHLTLEGRKTIEALFSRHAASMNELGQELTPRERDEAARLLRKLGRAARDKLSS